MSGEQDGAGAARAAREAWPAIEISEETFARYLAEHAAGAGAAAGLHVADLYLACGCALGLPAAIEAFERHILPVLDEGLRKQGVAAEAIPEIKQRVRTRLLLGDGGAPRITTYSGRGSLRSWVAVVAAREAATQRRADQRALGERGDDGLLDAAAPDPDPELAYFQRLYRAELRDAFREALAALGERERNLLRHHFLQGLSGEEIGRLYRVSRSTASLWIVKARKKLLAGTRRALRQRLRVTRSELQSILRLADGQIEVSLRGLMSGRTE